MGKQYYSRAVRQYIEGNCVVAIIRLETFSAFLIFQFFQSFTTHFLFYFPISFNISISQLFLSILQPFTFSAHIRRRLPRDGGLPSGADERVPLHPAAGVAIDAGLVHE